MMTFTSQVFWRWDGKWAFQKVGEAWNLYGEDGAFVNEFKSFKALCDYMDKQK